MSNAFVRKKYMRIGSACQGLYPRLFGAIMQGIYSNEGGCKPMENYTIRVAEETDAKAVHDIYGAYVDGENVTFTIDNPSVEDYRQKIIKTKKTYPFYIAEAPDGKILGYVYGSPLRPHDAYQWNVESTIMLAPDAPRRQGIATALYTKFMETLRLQHFQFVYGVLVDTNEPSIALHESLGFKEVGHFYNAGFKLGKWRGILWMQKQIGNLEAEELIPFSEICQKS